MKGDPVPNPDHVLRCVGGNHIDNGEIDGSGLLCRRNEPCPSVNWLEWFPGDLQNRVAEVRRRRRLKYGATARLARLNVGRTKMYILENDPNSLQINVIQDPLEEDSERGFMEDPSHSLMVGVPTVDTPEGELIGDLLAQCVIDSFPAKG